MPQTPNESLDAREAYITLPDYRLRKKIGKHVMLDRIFTSERIHRCQEMADQILDGLLQEMAKQIVQIGDSYMNAAQHPAEAESILERMSDLAFAVKKRMESLNFTFGFNVATSLCDYIQSNPVYNPDMFLAVCKHTAVLNNIVREKITGDGGKMGQEMLANLKALNKKLQK